MEFQACSHQPRLLFIQRPSRERSTDSKESFQENVNCQALALLNYRKTPLDGVGKSPAQLMMNHRLKSKLPAKLEMLKPETFQTVKPKLQACQMEQKYYYDQRAGKEKPLLKIGDTVRYKAPGNKGSHLGIIKQDITDTLQTLRELQSFIRIRKTVLKKQKSHSQNIRRYSNNQREASSPTKSDNNPTTTRDDK